MAAGSQIIISTDGIIIKTSKVFKVHAGQHQFKAGEAVAITQTSLPNQNSTYSNKFDYSINNADTGVAYALKTFVLDQAAGKLLAYQTSAQTGQAEISSQRFHTVQPQAVFGILALSDRIYAQQDPPIVDADLQDPLLEEALNSSLTLDLNVNDEV